MVVLSLGSPSPRVARRLNALLHCNRDALLFFYCVRLYSGLSFPSFPPLELRPVSDKVSQTSTAPLSSMSSQNAEVIFCFATFCRLQSQQCLQRLIVCGLPPSSTKMNPISKNLKLSLSHMCLTLRGSCHPAESLTALGTDPISSKLSSSSTSMSWQDTYSCLSADSYRITAFRFFWDASAFLKYIWSPNEPSRLTPTVDSTKRNDPSSGALGPGCRLPSDATSSSIRDPPLVGFRPPSFLHVFPHFFPYLEQLNFLHPNPVLQSKTTISERVSAEFSLLLRPSTFDFAQWWSKEPFLLHVHL